MAAKAASEEGPAKGAAEDEAAERKSEKSEEPAEESTSVKERLEEREEAEGSSNQPIASISVSQKAAEGGARSEAPKPSRLDLTHPDIPEHLHTLPVDGGSLTQRLERALGSVAPLLREIFVDFAPFLSKTLIGSHGQELLIGGECTFCLLADVVRSCEKCCRHHYRNE